MSTNRTRRRRGADTQRLVAQRLQADIFPFAEPVGAGVGGRDITGTPGVAIEVKARRGLALTEWLRQTVRQATGGDVPVLVVRPDGAGPTTIDEWPAILPLATLIELLQAAGYGNPPSPEGGTPGTLPAPGEHAVVDGTKIDTWLTGRGGQQWLGCLPCAKTAGGETVPVGMVHAPDCPHAGSVGEVAA